MPGSRRRSRAQTLVCHATGTTSPGGTTTVRWSDMEVVLERPVRLISVSFQATSKAPSVVSCAVMRADHDTVAVLKPLLCHSTLTRVGMKMPSTDFMIVALTAPLFVVNNTSGGDRVTWVLTARVQFGNNYQLKPVTRLLGDDPSCTRNP